MRLEEFLNALNVEEAAKEPISYLLGSSLEKKIILRPTKIAFLAPFSGFPCRPAATLTPHEMTNLLGLPLSPRADPKKTESVLKEDFVGASKLFGPPKEFIGNVRRSSHASGGCCTGGKL